MKICRHKYNKLMQELDKGIEHYKSELEEKDDVFYRTKLQCFEAFKICLEDLTDFNGLKLVK